MTPPAWRPYPSLRLPPRVLAELLDGGQAFRWDPLPETPGGWRGVFRQHVVDLRAADDGALTWRPLTPATTAADLADYLGDDRDFPALTDALPWRSDGFLADAIRAFPGLRILAQPLDEALLGFICSSTKRIVQIKAMVALLATRFGPELLPGMHALPSWETLATLDEADLRACKLGYRARYLHQTARLLAAAPDWSHTLAALPYAEARQWLTGLPGVGEKVADCVLLFGAGRLEAFPVDTWIVQVMANGYGLDGWTPSQIAHFGRTHFGPAAGLAQQFLFASVRETARRRARAK